MSARNSLPDSLELLLDTMCNTFGGVMFITLSLALLLCLSNKLVNDNAVKEIDPEELQRIRQETARLEEEIARLQRDCKIDEVPEQADDEARQKYLENKLKEMELKQKRHVLEQLQRTNKENSLRFSNEEKRLAKETQENEIELEKAKNMLVRGEGENDLLKARIAIKEQMLKNTKEKSINFARNESTFKTPVWVFITKNTFYRIDTELNMQDQLKVTKDDRTILLTPINGHPIGKELTVAETQSLLSGFPSSRYFCSLGIMPDSIEASVQLRRNLRELGYKVSYYVTPRLVLRFVTNPDYSSSD